uniref:Thioesterase domain-containing protein n=1 Tax=Amblyomma maculatum TaxID=34609 RepID=G3MRF5_AMBMU
MHMQRASNFIRYVKDLRMPYFDGIIDKMKLISCEDQAAQFELQVEKPHCNLNNVLHGGMATTLIDLCTCILMSTAYEKRVLFATTELKARYLRPAKLGDTILMEARIMHPGKTVAFAEMNILDKATRKICVQGTHTALLVPQE